MEVPDAQLGDPRDMLVLSGWGTLSSWIVALVSIAAAQAKFPLSAEWVGNSEDLTDFGNGRSRPPRLVMTQVPGASLHAALASPRLRVVAVLEEPYSAIEFCRCSTGVAPIAAYRAVAHSMSAHVALHNRSDTQIISRTNPFNSRETAQVVLAHLGLQLEATALRGLLDQFCGTEAEALSLDQALARGGSGLNFKPSPFYSP